MVNVQMTEQQLEIVRAALQYIFDEIEDDMVFEEVIGSTRWEAEELSDNLPQKRTRK
jgi:hypothetical protein